MQKIKGTYLVFGISHFHTESKYSIKRIWPLDDEACDPADDVPLGEEEKGSGPFPMRDRFPLFLGHAGCGPQPRLSIAGRLRARIRCWAGGNGGSAFAGCLLFRSTALRC